MSADTAGGAGRVWLFDLDGTLSDSARGIVGALRLAFDEFGLPPLSPEVERSLVGPPFSELLPPLVGLDRTPEVIAAYRRHYVDGGLMHDTALFPGVCELLAALQASGARMAVATSKPESYARPIVERLGLAEHFVTVAGDGLAGERGTKALVVAEALARLGDPDPAQVRMVGDRRHDVHGAAAHGVACLGAGWGYGAAGELEEAGVVEVFASAHDLTGALPRL